MKTSAFFFGLFALLLAFTGEAAPPLPALTVPRTETAPRVDADPADPAWVGAPLLASLALSPGADPGDAPLPTEVRLLWDAQYLYARFTCRQAEIDAPFTGRDRQHYQADVVEVFLDPVGDGRQYFEFEVTPKNQVLDARFDIGVEPRSGEDGKLLEEIAKHHLGYHLEWNCEGLRTAVRLQPGGWTADFALPAAPLLQRLGLTKFAPLTLRAHLQRYHWTEPYADPMPPSRRLIAMSWTPVIKGCPHISPSVMGFLKLAP